MTDGSLAYDDRGSGDVLVLIHGHPFDRSMWAPQVEALSSSLRVISVDLPGYGGSPVLPGKVLMREFADAVAGLLGSLGVERFTALGLSMGGLVTMELGLAYPERVAGVVLAATTAAPVTPEEAETRRVAADAIESDGMLAVAADMVAKLLGPDSQRDVKLVSDLFSMMLRASPVGAAAALRGRAERPDYSLLLRELQMPALVIAGDHDQYSPGPVTQQLIDSLQHPDVLLMPGCGHLPNLEDPERFNAGVLAFMNVRG